MEEDWKLIAHSSQIADTGDYDGYYEITDGNISLITKDDNEEALQPIVNALNESGCKFYQDDGFEFEFENKILKDEIDRLTFMIDNGLGWKDMQSNMKDDFIYIKDQLPEKEKDIIGIDNAGNTYYCFRANSFNNNSIEWRDSLTGLGLIANVVKWKYE